METRASSSSSFRHLLADLDPDWPVKSATERDDLVDWFARTARAIARQYANSFRDPCHDASDLLQEIRLKLLTKFRPEDAPHRLLGERPCMRNLMEWKGLDLVDWENAERRAARRRAPLPDEDIGLADRAFPSPDRTVEITESEHAYLRSIRDPEQRRIYLLFRSGQSPREVAHLLGRRVRDMKELREDLVGNLRERLLN